MNTQTKSPASTARMSLALEDSIGRVLLLAAFSLLAALKALSVWQLSRSHLDTLTALALVTSIVGLIFQVLVIVLTVVRLPAREAASGVEPRLTAIGGTFLLLAIVAFPPAKTSVEWQFVSLMIVSFGTALATYCAVGLGRSFSVMATARRLVTSGPYSIVRHPLYLSEIIVMVGSAMANATWGALVLTLVVFALQLRRMANEERVLRANFPEYDAYALRVPALVPGINWQK